MTQITDTPAFFAPGRRGDPPSAADGLAIARGQKDRERQDVPISGEIAASKRHLEQ
jgi:hypothetical protein